MVSKLKTLQCDDLSGDVRALNDDSLEVHNINDHTWLQGKDSIERGHPRVAEKRGH